MSTTVVNIRSGAEFDVYIGRAVKRARDKRCHVDSMWCNPIIARGAVVATAGQAVELYGAALEALVDESEGAREMLLALQGKRLGCWCKPGPCHGDAIVRLIDRLVARTPGRGVGAASPHISGD